MTTCNRSKQMVKTGKYACFFKHKDKLYEKKADCIVLKYDRIL